MSYQNEVKLNIAKAIVKAINKREVMEMDESCEFFNKGKCNSKYRKNKPCNKKLCPWKGGGSFAMAVHDQGNRINKK